MPAIKRRYLEHRAAPRSVGRIDRWKEARAMQFGLFGSASARRGGPEFDSSEGFRDFIEYNIEAEALGFHSSFVVEHHFTGYGQVSSTLNLLTWLGARTRWLRLGTAVIVLPWHNPVLLAEQAATLDLLSGGRLDFGIGKGYRYNEFAGFCVPMEEADARFDEALEVNSINGAYNSHEEAIKGSITPGKLADFVVLADDPHTAAPEKIKDIEIVRTVTGGATVYQK